MVNRLFLLQANLMKQNNQGLIAIHSAAFILGFTGIFATSISLVSIELISWRALFAAIVVAIFLIYKQHWQPLNKSQWLWLLFCGLTTCIHWVTYFHSMKIAGVAIGMIALFTFPVMTVLFEPWINRTRFHYQDLGAAFLVLVGVIFMVPEFSWHNSSTQGVLWGVLSAFVWSLRNIYFRKHLSEIASSQSMFVQLLICALLLAPFAWPSATKVSLQDWQLLMILAVFCTALPHTLILVALQHLSAKSGSLIACLQPVYGATLAWLILGQTVDYSTIIGGVFIISAAVYESLQSRKLNR